LAALAFAVYIGNGHMHGNGDTVPASLVAVVLLTDGSLRLDRFTEVSGPVPYFVVRTPRGVASLFPVATGILAAPFMMPAILAPTAPARAWIEAAHRQEKYAAALITAASVAVFVLLCWQLGFNDWLTIGLTLFYALGSQAFNTSSQLLWQHGPGTLFILLAFLCFVRLREHQTRAAAICFALAWAVAVAIRPMNVLLVGPLVAVALYRFPRLAAYTLLPAVLTGLPVVAYNLYFFGTLVGGYTQHSDSFFITRIGSGVAGLLLSPGRGLFLYFPVAAVALVLAAGRRTWTTDDIARSVLVSVAGAVLLFGAYEHWDAGYSVGPRLMTEVQPLLLVVLGLAWPPRARVLGAVCFGVLLPYCIFVQAVGAYSTGRHVGTLTECLMALPPCGTSVTTRSRTRFANGRTTPGYVLTPGAAVSASA
jgi:hypothetical protein